ncbi:MAG: hydroxyacid dehydrogenase [Alistipes sp.]|nr:hydroxyacid dehydrogenase [Alistipes sp.]
MKKIVFLDEYSIAGCDLSKITSQGEYVAYENTAKEQVVERLQGADIAITNKVLIDGEAMRQLPNLKLICVAATGMNNVDLNTAAELGIEVKNAVGYSTISVAETTLASALALARNVVYFDEYFHDGRYAKADRAFCYDRLTFQISGKRWGIIGLGNIGREVARLASAFGCEVRYFSTSGAKREEAYPAMELNELLEWSDIVSVHSPLNDRTRGLVGREELKRMKRSAMIINVARGGIIDEAALAEALNEGWIAAAALDVFSVEPLRESPLHDVKDRYRLLASPHNAWSAVESIDRLIDCVAENIRNFLAK